MQLEKNILNYLNEHHISFVDLYTATQIDMTQYIDNPSLELSVPDFLKLCSFLHISDYAIFLDNQK